MKTGAIVVAVVAAVVIGFGIYMTDIDVSGEVELPDVDVAVEGGELPNVDAEVGSVDVGSEEVTVEVPTIEVNPPSDGDDVADEDVADAEVERTTTSN